MRARRTSGGTRSPVGVPPRLLLRRPNATAQLRLRASWDAAATGVTRLAPAPVQRAPRRPVIVPAGRIPGAARGLLSLVDVDDLTLYINVLLRTFDRVPIAGKYIGSMALCSSERKVLFLKRQTDKSSM